MPGRRIAPMIIRTEVSTDRVTTWRTLTDPVLVGRWFTHATPVGAVGDAYELDFGSGDVMRGEILEVVQDERLVYSWGWGDSAPGARTRVTWTLDAADDGTAVTLTHDGWVEAGFGAAERDDHRRNWEEYVAALVELGDELAEGDRA